MLCNIQPRSRTKESSTSEHASNTPATFKIYSTEPKWPRARHRRYRLPPCTGCTSFVWSRDNTRTAHGRDPFRSGKQHCSANAYELRIKGSRKGDEMANVTLSFQKL